MAEGSTDAEANAQDVITTFGADYLASIGGRCFLFLDVEGAPSLSLPYYTGWSQTLVAHSQEVSNGKATVLPCVYATRADTGTWQAIASAAGAGVACLGVWAARWRRDGCSPLLDWDNEVVLPTVALPCKVLLWQYAADCHGGSGFDCDQTNPNLDVNQDLLQQLIPPPPDPDIIT